MKNPTPAPKRKTTRHRGRRLRLWSVALVWMGLLMLPSMGAARTVQTRVHYRRGGSTLAPRPGHLGAQTDRDRAQAHEDDPGLS